MWAASGRKQETWLPETWRRLRWAMTFFSSVFTSKCSSHTTQVVEGKGRDAFGENEEPAVGDQA